MKELKPLHSWDVTPTEAVALQRELASRIDVTRPLGPYETIAAADISWDKFAEQMYAAVVLVRAGTFELIERVGIAAPVTFPYVPGLFSFREAPGVLRAFAGLKQTPDVVMCDGQGYSHPRRIGLASHVGLWLGIPTIGVAKSRLVGEYDEPGPERGDQSPLTHKGEVIGTVLRTRNRVSPLFVSPGHLCDFEGANRLVLETTVRYRLPVPARMVHEYVNEIRRAVNDGQPVPP